MGLDSRKAFIPTRAPFKLLSTKTARRLQLNLPLPDLDQMSRLHFDLVLRVRGPGNFGVMSSSEQPWIKSKWFGLADGDILEAGMRRVDEVVEFARNNDARQSQHR